MIELLELDAVRQVGHLGVEVAPEDARDDDDDHRPERGARPRCRASPECSDDEHRADRAGHQVEVEPHRVRREPSERLDAPEDRIDRGDQHEAGADEAAERRRADRAGAERRRLRMCAVERRSGDSPSRSELVNRDDSSAGKPAGATSASAKEREQADKPEQQRRVAAARTLARPPVRMPMPSVNGVTGRISPCGPSSARSASKPVRAPRHRRRALAEQIERVDLDQRAGRAGRHAGLIAVRDAVIALVGDPARRARRAACPGRTGSASCFSSRELEVLPERRRVGLDLDHVDRAVRARLRARGAAGAGRLVDHDLALLRGRT